MKKKLGTKVQGHHTLIYLEDLPLLGLSAKHIRTPSGGINLVVYDPRNGAPKGPLTNDEAMDLTDAAVLSVARKLKSYKKEDAVTLH